MVIVGQMFYSIEKYIAMQRRKHLSDLIWRAAEYAHNNGYDAEADKLHTINREIRKL